MAHGGLGSVQFKVQTVDGGLYSHRVEFWCAKEELLPVGRWIKARAIPCNWVGYHLYLREQDLAVFLLRWAS